MNSLQQELDKLRDALIALIGTSEMPALDEISKHDKAIPLSWKCKTVYDLSV